MTLQRNTPLDQAKAAKTYQDNRRARLAAIVEAGGELPRLASVSRQRRERDEAAGRSPRRQTLRQGPGFAVSPAQREKVRGLASIVSGQGPCDPAHLWPRSMCGDCTNALDVIPLTREEHRLFDEGKLDILPALIDHGCFAEIAHAIEAHHADPLSLLHRLTGERHEPESTVLRRAEDLARRMVRDGVIA